MKAVKILQKTKPTEKHYKEKIKLLAQMINEPEDGHILPPKLYQWAVQNRMKITEHATDGCIWDTVHDK